jgi:hypothetical protein
LRKNSCLSPPCGRSTVASTSVAVRLASSCAWIDDVEYANLLPVPLTTVHQPCREIGVAAMAAMLERVTNPDLRPELAGEATGGTS